VIEMQTRRTFLYRTLGAAGAALVLSNERLYGSQDAPILINHVGFPLQSSKKFLVASDQQSLRFEIVDKASGRTVERGVMNAKSGDFGTYLMGEARSTSIPGTYELRTEQGAAVTFAVSDQIYSDAIRKCINYFRAQRCGDSKTGYHAPCHLDDGKRSDTGEHLDVSGGWHDACDLRKWVDATIYGMIGLANVLDSGVLGGGVADQMIDEMRWGNTYFQKMQDPAGFVMNYCGGDDGNNFTDNRVGSGDDRVIHVEPAELPAQFHFVTAQAALAKLTREKDPAYARECQSRANRCFQWCLKHRSPGAATSLGAGILAALELRRAFEDASAVEIAASFARKLLSLQVPNDSDGLGGFFLAAEDRRQPLREIQHGNLVLIALASLASDLPTHPDAPAWRVALERHCEHLNKMSERSVFGTIPFGLYTNEDPGGNRRIGSYWYRWFMKPSGEYRANDDWWVGVNAHLASNGVGLCRAAAVLQNTQLRELAQRQLDWVLGVNPFDASTIVDVGRNQPALYRSSQFKPNTPSIPGGVMNGFGGSERDEPVLLPGSYHTCEYWTPMVAHTMWLLAELQRS
jgi:hypothetical protein